IEAVLALALDEAPRLPRRPALHHERDREAHQNGPDRVAPRWHSRIVTRCKRSGPVRGRRGGRVRVAGTDSETDSEADSEADSETESDVRFVVGTCGDWRSWSIHFGGHAGAAHKS